MGMFEGNTVNHHPTINEPYTMRHHNISFVSKRQWSDDISKASIKETIGN